MENSNVDADQRAPHDGEFIGTIEAVVLRCFPDENSTPPATPPSSKDAKPFKKESSSSESVEESETDGLFLQDVFDSVADTKPSTKRKPSPLPPPKGIYKSKPKADKSGTNVQLRGGIFDGGGNIKPAPKSKAKCTQKDTRPSKAKLKRQMFGLDGAWDWDEEVNNRSWDAPASDKSTASKNKKKDDAWDTSDNPAPPKGETKTNSLFAWDHPHSPKDGITKTKAWGSWDNPTIPTGEPHKGRVEMTSANTGRWHPSGTSANSSKTIVKRKGQLDRSDSRANFSQDWDTSPPRDGSDRGRSRKPRSPINHDRSSPTMKIRGGGPGSYSVSSNHGAATPSVIININNGPPPPRDWQAEEARERENSKRNGKKSPPANDPWTTDLPAYDPEQDPDVKKKKDKKKNKQMPGAWDQGDSCWGDKNDQANSNNDWGNTGNDDNKNSGNDSWGNDNWNNTGNDENQDNGDDWNNNANDTDWNAPKDDAQKNDDGWGNNDNNDTEQANGWDNSSGDNKPETGGWGNDNGQGNNSWDADMKDEPKVTVGAKDPATLKPAKNNPSSNPTHPTAKKAVADMNSKANGSTAGSTKSKASKKGKQKAFNFGDWGKDEPGKATSTKAESKKATSPKPGTPKSILKNSPKQPSIPGACSPPLPSTKSKSKSPKAKTPPNTKAPTPKHPFPKPILSISTAAPKPQPYWSTWKDASPTDQKISEVADAANEIIQSILSEPVYSVPASVARRTSMSHQVRPGRSSTYRHKRGVPRYMDTFEKPYAVFRFHYRDKEIVECLTGTTIIEPEVNEKHRLASLSKHEIIEAFMKVKRKLGEEVEESDRATFKSNPHGVLEGPDAEALDERLKKLETSAEEEEEGEKVSGWLDNTDENGGGGNGVGEWAENKDDGEGTWGDDDGNGNGESSSKGNGKGNTKGKGKGKGRGKGKGKGKGKGNANGNNNGNWNSNGNRDTTNGANDRNNNTNNSTEENKDDNDWSGNGGNDWSNNYNNANAGGDNSWDNDAGGGGGGW